VGASDNLIEGPPPARECFFITPMSHDERPEVAEG